jgi:hypothetical protein
VCKNVRLLGRIYAILASSMKTPLKLEIVAEVSTR